MALFNFRRNATANEHSNSNIIDEKQASPLAIIYRSELDYLSRCILDYPNIETGGQLFGFWTSQGAPVVLYAIGPGEHANHEITFFNQDIDYLNAVGYAILHKYSLQHIGEWHSHHQLGLAQPSGHDATTMFHGLQNIPQRRLLLCIGNYSNGQSSINPYTFHENDMRHYTFASWLVKEVESPYRKLIDNELGNILIHPQHETPNHGQQRIVDRKEANEVNELKQVYWLMRNGNVDVMRRMLITTAQCFNTNNAVPQMSEEGIIQINVNNGEYLIRFPENFPQQAPLYFVNDEQQQAPEWKATDSDEQIEEAYNEWLKELTIISE